MKSLILFAIGLCLVAPLAGCAKQDEEKPVDVLTPADQQKQGGPRRAVPSNGVAPTTGTPSSGTK